MLPHPRVIAETNRKKKDSSYSVSKEGTKLKKRLQGSRPHDPSLLVSVILLSY